MENGFYFSLGIALILGLLPFVTPMPRSVASAGIVAAILIMASDFMPIPNRPSLLVVALFLVGVLALAASVYLYRLQIGVLIGSASISQKIDSESGFYIECGAQTGAIKIPSDGRIYFAFLSETQSSTGLGVLSSPPSQQEYSFRKNSFMDVFWCRLSNYERQPALDIRINLTLYFRKIVTAKDGGRTGGPVISERQYPIQISKIDPNYSGAFTFYLVSFSKHGINVALPDKISARLINEGGARDFKLTVAGGGLPLFLFPPEELAETPKQ